MASRARAAEPPAARRAARKPAPPRRSDAPVVLDSSCWLEHFADRERAPLFAKVIDAADALVVPLIAVYEVVEKLSRTG